MALSGVAWMVAGMVEMENAVEDPLPLPRRCREERGKTRGDNKRRGGESDCCCCANHGRIMLRAGVLIGDLMEGDERERREEYIRDAPKIMVPTDNF